MTRGYSELTIPKIDMTFVDCLLFYLETQSLYCTKMRENKECSGSCRSLWSIWDWMPHKQSTEIHKNISEDINEFGENYEP